MRKLAVVLIAVLPGVMACNEAPRPVTVIEDGCLTGSGAQFVLTDLERAEPHPLVKHQPIAGARARATTEAYMLSDVDEKLTHLVGKRVRVVGEADVADVAEIRHISPYMRVQKVASSDRTPAVNDLGVLRFEVRRLRVRSVSPTGDDCTTEFRSRA